jgi:hypothetical protein
VPGSNSLATIAYCFPSDKFQVYFAHPPFSAEKMSALRKDILKLGAFKQAPKTLTLNLASDNVESAKEAFAVMARRVKELGDSGNSQ